MLNVTDLGQGPPILWIHGFPLASSMYEHQLAIKRVRHVMPDLPGFGQSRSAVGNMTMDDYARIAIDLLDHRGIDRAVVAGFSMGGYISFAIARLAPERLRGLILLDTRETADDEKTKKGRYETIAKVKKEGIGPVIESMLAKMLTTAAPPEMRERVREIMTSSSADGVTAALGAMAERPDSTPLLPAIAVPTLVIVGEEDPITPPTDAERMAAAIPGARLVRVPGAAHLANYEQAEEVNGAVAKFMTTV